MSRFDKTTNINIEDIDLEKLKAEVEADRKARRAKRGGLFKSKEEPKKEEAPKFTLVEEESKPEKEEKSLEKEEHKPEETKDEPKEEKISEEPKEENKEELKDTDEVLFEPADEEIIEEIEDEEIKDIVKNDFQEQTIIEMKKPNLEKIGIASDHRGYKLKQKLTKYLTKKGYIVVDYGCDGTYSCDYPEFGFKLGKGIAEGEVGKGIAICGSGIGISIACNKIKGVRCAKVDNTKEAKYTRRDNDANVIALAGNMPLIRAKDIVDVYLKTKFTGLERHQKRIDMLNERE